MAASGRSTRQRLLALALFAGGARAADFDPEIQRSFIDAIQKIEQRDYEAAIGSLRAVLTRTGSPRVKLELARALFYHRDYAEARALFREVLIDADTPWRVRDNIEAFIREIDNIRGFRKYSVSLVRDSNPLNITSQREFVIGGFRLTFVPPENNKPVTGLRYAVQALQPLSTEAQMAAYLAASYLDYPGIAVDRLTLDAGLSKGVGTRGALKAGVEAGTFSNRRLYEFPYVGAEYRFVHDASQQIAGALKLGRSHFFDFGYLDAVYGSAMLSGLRAISDRAFLSTRLSAEHNEAYEHPYSYNGLALAPGVMYLMTQPPVLVAASLALARRDYAAVDPFFGEQRVDRKKAIELRLQHKEWRWQDAKPALVLSAEQNRSSIDFYSYRKINVSIVLE